MELAPPPFLIAVYLFGVLVAGLRLIFLLRRPEIGVLKSDFFVGLVLIVFTVSCLEEVLDGYDFFAAGALTTGA